MDWSSMVGGAAGGAVGVGLLGLLGKNRVVVRLSESVKHEYDSKLEELRRDMTIRDRAALVAELIAEWEEQSRRQEAPQPAQLRGFPVAPT